MKSDVTFYIVSYFSLSDKRSIVGGLRPYYLFQKLKDEGFNVKLITSLEAENSIAIKEGFFIKLLKPLFKIFPPDYTVLWSLKVFLYLLTRGRKEKNIIFTTSPPYGIGMTGWLGRLFLKNTKWVADYRDLWIENPLYKPLITKKFIDPILEKLFHKHADLVVLNTKKDLELHQRLYPFIREKSIFIRNGFNKLNQNKSNEKLRFIYAGGTNRGYLTEKIIHFLNELNAQGLRFEGDFYGEKDDFMDQSDLVHYKGKIASEEIPELLTNYKYGMLYLPEGGIEGGRMSQKFYDYIGSGLIPICFNASLEMKGIIDDLDTGLAVYESTPMDEVISFLRTASFKASNDQLRKYTRTYQFENLIEKIKESLDFNTMS